jgi:hypothetical protein
VGSGQVGLLKVRPPQIDGSEVVLCQSSIFG